MRKLTLFLVAALLLLGATQCKKEKPSDGKTEVFTLKANIGGGDKSINPYGQIDWNAGDKIFMYKADGTGNGIVLTYHGNGEFQAETGVDDDTYHFYYLGSNPPSTTPDGSYTMDLSSVDGTIEDVERCNLRTALNVSVTDNEATASFQNQIAFAYFDLQRDAPDVRIYGSAIYGAIHVNLTTGTCTPTNLKNGDSYAINISTQTQSFYLPLVPTPENEHSTMYVRFKMNALSSEYYTIFQYCPDGQDYVRFERNIYYSTADWGPINLLGNFQSSVSGTSVSDVTTTTATVTYTAAEPIQSIAITGTGVCYGTQANPTTSDAHVEVENPSYGEQTLNLTDLLPGTTYYVRPYATTAFGTAYGPEVAMTTLAPTGCINGVFSVAADKQVYFSQGNLQYQASTDIWRFAENQWDWVGGNMEGFGNVYENGVKCSNVTPSSTYTGWIDLFGWATSGYNHNNAAYQPWSYGGEYPYSNYYAYGESANNLYDGNGTADWGYNAISNGGNIEDQWRTLTKDEWDYLKNTRAGASEKWGHAKVEAVNGFVFLPDNWTLPTGCSFAPATLGENEYTESQWEQMQAHGAVFLPLTSRRYQDGRVVENDCGYYWSSSVFPYNSPVYVQMFGFNYNSLGSSMYSEIRATGLAVRLVQDRPSSAK